MKKIILLLSVTLLACGSDDSNDNSNQTFLERFDGNMFQRSIVFESNAPFFSYTLRNNLYISFSNSNKFYLTASQGSIQSSNPLESQIVFCSEYGEGVNDFRGQLYCEGCSTSDDIYALNILENTRSRLKFTMDYTNYYDDFKNKSIYLYEFIDGRMIESVQDIEGGVILRADLTESLTAYDNICKSYILSD